MPLVTLLSLLWFWQEADSDAANSNELRISASNRRLARPIDDMSSRHPTCWTIPADANIINPPTEKANGGQIIMQFTETASAGNGGVATASANGGAVAIGDVNSGGNAGNAIGVGDTWGGPVAVDGGSVANSTQLSISANGGTAIADASGGNYNLAFVS
jgi:hypothetical protein